MRQVVHQRRGDPRAEHLTQAQAQQLAVDEAVVPRLLTPRPATLRAPAPRGARGRGTAGRFRGTGPDSHQPALGPDSATNGASAMTEPDRGSAFPPGREPDIFEG